MPAVNDPNPPAGVWLAERQEKLQAAERRSGPRGVRSPLQPRLEAELSATLDRAGVQRGVALWNSLMRGIEYHGAHRTALNVLNGSLKYTGIPDLPAADPAWLAPLEDGPRWHTRTWNVYGAAGYIQPHERGRHLAAYDVNGMYLSAAASEMGTGAPELVEWPTDAGLKDILKRPGWCRVSTLEGAPWSIADTWEEGMWMPNALVAYLRDAGAQFLVPEALVWRTHRRWLDPHVNLLRAARAELLELGDPAALAVSRLVKPIYTRMFGGLLRSDKHNHGATVQPAWALTIEGLAQARMFRALDKTYAAKPEHPVDVVGIDVDAVWFTLPAGWPWPPGLELSRQLGKFKPAGRTPWTAALHEAYAHDKHHALWEALDVAGKAGKQ